MSFRVTRAADADLEGIGRYTLRRWGPQQATGYLRDIDSCFGRLAAFPQQGRARPELGEAYRVFDKERTGQIAVSEMRHILSNLPEKLSHEEIDEMLRTADKVMITGHCNGLK